MGNGDFFSCVFTFSLATLVLGCQNLGQFGTGWDEFNLNGKPRLSTTFWHSSDDLDYKEEVEFNPNGQVKQMRIFASGSLQAEIQYYYGVAGRLDSVVETNTAMNRTRIVSVYYEYLEGSSETRIKRVEGRKTIENWNGGKLLSTELKISGIGVTHVNFEYDSNGNLVKEKYREESVSKPDNLYEYRFEITEFDEQKNWVSGKSVGFQGNNPPQIRNHLKRTIEYF